MTSIWLPERRTLQEGHSCPGCTAVIWRSGEWARESRGFWRAVYDECEEEGLSARLSTANTLVPERDLRRNRVYQSFHVCEFDPRIAPYFNSFASSAAFSRRSGLNGHALRFQLRVGLLLPFVRPRHHYQSSVRLDIMVPLHGLPAYYWGPKLVIRGNSNVSWSLNIQAAGDYGVEYSFTADSLRAFSTGGAPGCLCLCPFDVVAEPRHGPREDLQVTYVQCLWIETHYPVPEGSSMPRPFLASEEWRGVQGNNLL